MVPRDLATRSNKITVVTDQPKIQTSPSLLPETPPPPIQELSRVSDTTPAIATSLVIENASNANNDLENMATQSHVTAPTSMHSDHKAIRSAYEPNQASLTDMISPAAERPAYISTSECNYGDAGFTSHRLEEVHSYYYFTIVAAIVVGLCLDFVILLAVFLPALWFANKVSGIHA